METVSDQLTNKLAVQDRRENRQNYLDWLRVGAMVMVVLYHSWKLFGLGPWQIDNATLKLAIDGFTRFLDVWVMPLFFLLAGTSIWFALDRRTPGRFIKERLLRLGVPLIFGMLVIVPPQVYTQRVYEGDFSGSFLAWYPHTFQGVYSLSNPASGNLSWHHLWFLVYLLVFSLILLPLFWYLKNKNHRLLITRIVSFLEKPGAIFLLAIPLIIINLTLRSSYGWGNQNLINDWADFLFYLTVLFYGFLLVSDSRMIQIAQRNRHFALIAAIISGVGIVSMYVNLIAVPDAIGMTVFYILTAIACWFWILTILGFSSRLLNFGNKFLKYASDAVLPVYILHQTVIVTLAYYVIRWDTVVAVKYFFIFLASLAVSLGIYEVVKRTAVTRFLFGIKNKKMSASQAAESQVKLSQMENP